LAERGLSVASRINLGVLCELRGESLPAQTSWPTNIHQCPWRGSGSRAERHGVALNPPPLNSCDEDEPPCCAGTRCRNVLPLSDSARSGASRCFLKPCRRSPRAATPHHLGAPPTNPVSRAPAPALGANWTAEGCERHCTRHEF